MIYGDYIKIIFKIEIHIEVTLKKLRVCVSPSIHSPVILSYCKSDAGANPASQTVNKSITVIPYTFKLRQFIFSNSPASHYWWKPETPDETQRELANPD